LVVGQDDAPARFLPARRFLAGLGLDRLQPRGPRGRDDGFGFRGRRRPL